MITLNMSITNSPWKVTLKQSHIVITLNISITNSDNPVSPQIQAIVITLNMSITNSPLQQYVMNCLL